MGTLEQIKQMREEGIPDNKIMANLKEQGVPPKTINDSFNQIRIKEAVSPTDIEGGSLMQSSGGLETPRPIEMQETYSPSPIMEQPASYSPEISQEQYYPQQSYEQGTYDYGTTGDYNSDMMIEIAEQVFLEKAKKIEKQIESLNEFKTLAQTKIDNFSERLKRMETIIDKLQASILGKIGSYGENLESIKKEMSMMQDSFGKMVPALHEKHTHTAHHKTTHKHAKKTSKKK